MEEQRLISYGDTAKFEIAEEEINGGTVAFEINTEELFTINDLKEKRNERKIGADQSGGNQTD